jgi:C4-dicarboxylate transporter DctM subunit
MNTAIIFGLLAALMLTGMPVSISLGLTVLSFLFFMTQVPIESVALKLFTGIEKFEIMAIPFFILAGNFLTHGGVARRMIHFATSLVGHWPGGLGLGAVWPARCLPPYRAPARRRWWRSDRSCCRRWSRPATR